MAPRSTPYACHTTLLLTASFINVELGGMIYIIGVVAWLVEVNIWCNTCTHISNLHSFTQKHLDNILFIINVSIFCDVLSKFWCNICNCPQRTESHLSPISRCFYTTVLYKGSSIHSMPPHRPSSCYSHIDYISKRTTRWQFETFSIDNANIRCNTRLCGERERERGGGWCSYAGGPSSSEPTFCWPHQMCTIEATSSPIPSQSVESSQTNNAPKPRTRCRYAPRKEIPPTEVQNRGSSRQAIGHYSL